MRLLLKLFLAATVMAAEDPKTETKKIERDEAGNLWPNAVAVTSPHYSLLTDLDETERTTMVRGLEELYATFTTLYGEIKKKDRLTVYLFKEELKYNASFGKNHPDAARMKSFGFYSASERIAHFKHRGSFQPTIEALRHECTHQLFDVDRGTAKQVLAKPFFWVHEGIACYMETLETRDGKTVFGNTDHYLFSTMIKSGKQQGAALDIAAFSNMNQKEMMKEHLKNYIFAATLVHFFLHGTTPEEAAKFKQFVLAVENAEGSPATFQRIMGKPISAYQKQWSDYVNALSKETWEKAIK